MRPSKIHLQKIGALWHYRFQVDGVRTQRSTKETVRQRAERVAERAYREAQLWSRSGRAVPTVSELVAQWLIANEQTASRSHLSGIETFGRLHLFGLADVLIDDLTTEMVERARNEYLKTHAPVSANHWSRTIRLLCNWAVHRGIIPSAPFKIKLIKVQKKPRSTLPVAHTAQWLASIDAVASPGVQIAVRLMLGVGLRESEASSARWEWADLTRKTYTPGRTKGREADPIPMPVWLVEYLRPLQQPSGLVIAKPDGRPFGRGFTRAGIIAASKRSGIGHITPHRLRGTFATLLSEHGAPIQAIQKALRHKSSLTTIGYLETDMRAVSIAQELIAEHCGINQ
jgi:integrase/recombinase XerC